MHRLAAGMATTLVLVVAATPGAAWAQRVTPKTKVTENGLGPIRVGMTLREARESTGQKIDVVDRSPSWDIRAMLDERLDATVHVDHTRISFVVVGTPARPGGGLLSRFPDLALPRLRDTFGSDLDSAPSTIVPRGTDYWVDVPGRPHRDLVWTFKDGELRLVAGGRLPTAEYPGVR